MGLARYYQGAVDDAVACFNAAMAESAANPDVACVLAQVLWATGREDARERAREVLFGVIEQAPHHVQSVLLLGVIALLDEDDESLEAVVAELQSLRASDEGVSPADQRRLGEVLRAAAAFGKGGATGAAESKDELQAAQARADVMFHPWLPHGWSEIAALGGGEEQVEGEVAEGKSAAAEMAVRVALKAVPPRGELAAEDLALAYAGTGRARDAQTAVMVAPWEKAGWAALGSVVRG
ncbi:hypothetical protein VTK26DRAFT_4436 [Humicola hyalothermophila]